MNKLGYQLMVAEALNDWATADGLLSDASSASWVRGIYTRDQWLFFMLLLLAECEYQDMKYRKYLYVALCQDFIAESYGMHTGDRVTCGPCRTWADHPH